MNTMGMCKICGAIADETEQVDLGGSSRQLCQQCATRDVPMMHRTPGRHVGVSG